MRWKTLKSVILGVLVLSSLRGFGQTKEITVRFIGNCGLYMTDGSLNLYTDFPYKSGAYGYMEYDKAELDSVRENAVFLFTHEHADHYSGRVLRQLLKEKNGIKFTPWRTKKLERFCDTVPGFNVRAFKTKHRLSLKHDSYLITWHGKRIFLSGDTESADTIAEVKDIDVAFVPYWLLDDAREKGITIDAKRRALYHLYPNQNIAGDIPDDMTVLKNEGRVIKISY